MTLDIEKLFKNIIEKQAKVNHFSCKVKATKTDKIPSSVKKLIFSEYGEKYLDDSDYVIFFWGNITKDNIESLFKVADAALGKSANKMTKTDFKPIKLDTADSSEENTEDVEKDDENDTSSEDSDETTDLNSEISNILNEDDSSEEEEKPEVNNRFFLKATIK